MTRDRNNGALQGILDDDVRWSSPTTLPGGGVRRGRRAVLEQAVLVFERLSSVVVERMSTSVVGDGATVRGRYRTMQGLRVDFVERIHIKEGRIVALRGNMRTDQVARRRARATPTVTTARVGDAWGAARSSSRTARAEDKRDGVGRPRPGLIQARAQRASARPKRRSVVTRPGKRA